MTKIESWSEERLPENWIGAQIVPLYKGRRDKSKNYSGISRGLSVVGKVSERMIIE